VHDFIVLHSKIDMADVRSKCVRLFEYRRRHAWPAIVKKGERWDEIYDVAMKTIGDKTSLCPTVDEAVDWVNELIARIDNA